MTTTLEIQQHKKTIERLILDLIYNPKLDPISLERRINESLQKIPFPTTENRTEAFQCLMTIVNKYLGINHLFRIPDVMKDSLFPYMSTRDLSRFLTVNRLSADTAKSEYIQPQLERRKKQQELKKKQDERIKQQRKNRIRTAFGLGGLYPYNLYKILHEEFSKGATFHEIRPYIIDINYRDYKELLLALMKKEYDQGRLNLKNIPKFLRENNLPYLKSLDKFYEYYLPKLYGYIVISDFDKGKTFSEIYSEGFPKLTYESLIYLFSKQIEKGTSLFEMIPLIPELCKRGGRNYLLELIMTQYKTGKLTLDQINQIVNHIFDFVIYFKDDFTHGWIDQFGKLLDFFIQSNESLLELTLYFPYLNCDKFIMLLKRQKKNMTDDQVKTVLDLYRPFGKRFCEFDKREESVLKSLKK